MKLKKILVQILFDTFIVILLLLAIPLLVPYFAGIFGFFNLIGFVFFDIELCWEIVIPFILIYCYALPAQAFCMWFDNNYDYCCLSNSIWN